MKQLMIILIASVMLIPCMQGADTFGGYASMEMHMLNDDCDDLKEEVERLKEQIAAIDEPTEDNEQSELDRLKEEVDESKARLDNFESDHESHGPNVRRELQRLRDALDAAREAYHAKLAELKGLIEELLEKLQTLKDDCVDELTGAERNRIDQDIDDYDDRPNELEEEMDQLEEDAVEEELERLGVDLERNDNETEGEYRARLRDYRARYPWLEPEQGNDESDRDFRRRQRAWEDFMDRKWRRGFWRRVQEEIRRRIDREIDDSNTRERKADNDDDGLPQDQDKEEDDRNDDDSQRERDQEEEFFYSLRLGGVYDAFDVPYREEYFSRATLEELQTGIYEDPDLFTAIAEQVEGEFFFGTYSTAPSYINHEVSKEARYGIFLSKDILPKVEGSIQLQYAKAQMRAKLPITVIGFTATNSRQILGDYELSKQSARAQLGINYRFSNRSWQPIVGVWLGAEHQNWQSEARIETVSWQLNEYTDSEWSYGLNAALRWQSSGLLFGELHGQWGHFEGESRYGLGLGIGIGF